MKKLLIHILHLVYEESEKEGVEYRQDICEIVVQSKDPPLNWSAVLKWVWETDCGRQVWFSWFLKEYSDMYQITRF